jgi:hypothetical protein
MRHLSEPTRTIVYTVLVVLLTVVAVFVMVDLLDDVPLFKAFHQ